MFLAHFEVVGVIVFFEMAVIVPSSMYTIEKRADHSLRDEQGRFRLRSFLRAVAPRFSIGAHR